MISYSQDEVKGLVAQAAIEFITPQLAKDTILGIGTGSTVDVFIDRLAASGLSFMGAVSSSERSTKRLQHHGIRVFDLNEVDARDGDIDAADEVNAHGEVIKGGCGALTREHIVPSVVR